VSGCTPAGGSRARRGLVPPGRRTPVPLQHTLSHLPPVSRVPGPYPLPRELRVGVRSTSLTPARCHPTAPGSVRVVAGVLEVAVLADNLCPATFVAACWPVSRLRVPIHLPFSWLHSASRYGLHAPGRVTAGFSQRRPPPVGAACSGSGRRGRTCRPTSARHRRARAARYRDGRRLLPSCYREAIGRSRTRAAARTRNACILADYLSACPPGSFRVPSDEGMGRAGIEPATDGL
jgi:hypothetical protein